MQDIAQISEFGKILIFLITGSIFIGLLFFANRLISRRDPTPEKLTTYECGEEPTGNAWLPFNSRFYVIALVFLLFDVEMVFVFPWATVYADKQLIAAEPRWGWLSLTEMFIFLGILILGLAYVWAKGDLEWIKPKQVLPVAGTHIPSALYDKLNLQQAAYQTRPFAAPPSVEQVSTEVAVEAPAKRPMFKPSFKKPSNDA